MDRLRKALRRRSSLEQYEQVSQEATALEGSALLEGQDEVPFSWVEYGIFALLGMAMLWAWNMFLAAAPYFQMRFQSDDWISNNFQSAILTVSTITNLTAMLILTKIQYTASYPFRINLALAMNTVVFSLLTTSTAVFLDATAPVYLFFLLAMVGCTAWATGLLQNGAFAFAASFGRPEYMQALMVGQGVAGVLPPIAQIVSVLSVPAPEANAAEGGTPVGSSAFIYFCTAVAVSVTALVAFMPLVRRHNHIIENRMVEHMAESMQSIEEAERAARKITSMGQLFRKLHWLAAAIFLCFAVSMFFPVLTTKVLSVRTPVAPSNDGEPMAEVPRLFRPEAFIPLAFFFWNAGDFSGRLATMLPFSLHDRPVLLFALGVGRLLFLPLYLLCNIGGRGAVLDSDFFYLFLVQFPFGMTSGWLASSSMMASSEWVAEGEREAAGGFMGLCLVAGLTVGSLLSFTVAGI